MRMWKILRLMQKHGMEVFLLFFNINHILRLIKLLTDCTVSLFLQTGMNWNT